jgi:hypothetical protein
MVHVYYLTIDGMYDSEHLPLLNSKELSNGKTLDGKDSETITFDETNVFHPGASKITDYFKAGAAGALSLAPTPSDGGEGGGGEGESGGA